MMYTAEQVAQYVLSKEAAVDSGAIKKMVARMNQMRAHTAAKSVSTASKQAPFKPPGLLDKDKQRMIERKIQDLDARHNALAPVTRPQAGPQYDLPIIEPKVAALADTATRALRRLVSAEGRALAIAEARPASKTLASNEGKSMLEFSDEK